MCAALAACGGDRLAADGRAAQPKQVRIDWIGYESFLFTASSGRSILTNPYSSQVAGRAFPGNLKPAVVLVSDDHPGSNNVDGVEHEAEVFQGPMAIGSNNASGTHIRGVPIYPTPDRPVLNAGSIVFLWRMDGMRFCFLGNVPRALSDTEIREIGAVDVLLMPVGVPATLSDADRRIIVGQLRPRIVIPMGSPQAFTTFASTLGETYQVPGSSVLLSPENFPPQMTSLIFSSP